MRARLCVTLLFAACMSACTIPESCDLHNNSGSDLTILRSQLGQEGPPIHVKSGASILLADWRAWEYRVAMGGTVLHYVPERPETEFVVQRGLGLWVKRVFRAQIEPDGRIFVLKPGQAVPAKEFVEQPSGFPLIPKPRA